MIALFCATLAMICLWFLCIYHVFGAANAMDILLIKNVAISVKIAYNTTKPNPWVLKELSHGRYNYCKQTTRGNQT